MTHSPQEICLCQIGFLRLLSGSSQFFPAFQLRYFLVINISRHIENIGYLPCFVSKLHNKSGLMPDSGYGSVFCGNLLSVLQTLCQRGSIQEFSHSFLKFGSYDFLSGFCKLNRNFSTSASQTVHGFLAGNLLVGIMEQIHPVDDPIHFADCRNNLIIHFQISHSLFHLLLLFHILLHNIINIAKSHNDLIIIPVSCLQTDHL